MQAGSLRRFASRNDEEDKHLMSVTTTLHRGAVQQQPGRLVRLFDYKPFLIIICLTPAIGLLLVFLTYPLGLGVWLAFTDTTIGPRGGFASVEKSRRAVMLGIALNNTFL